VLGATFLIAACLHWKCCDQIQGGFQVEEVPAAEIVLKCDKVPKQSVVSKFLKALNDVRVSVGTMSGGLVDEMPTNKTNQSLAPPFWLGHTAVFRPVKTIVQRESRHWIHSMNGHLALRPDRGLLLGVTHNISQRVLI
jgi:hypothetical protein